MVGILVVQGSGLDAVMENFYGNFFSLLSGVCIAITYIFASKIRKNTSNVIYGRSLFLVAALTIALVAIIFAVPLLDFSFEKQFQQGTGLLFIVSFSKISLSPVLRLVIIANSDLFFFFSIIDFNVCNFIN